MALEQTALSHVLNAEGEKLQKAIAMDSISTPDILLVNASVTSMVKAITSLEAVLHDKLSLIGDCTCQCPKPAGEPQPM